ncbi:MAG TPA: hypothetical protein VK524_09145 [Polyangiaceae bacterium]|nr:hypothetical protein [Polyangiaceae bacterium]
MSFMNPDTASDPRQQLDRALSFVRRVRHFAWTIAATVAVGAVLCGVFLLVRTPRYVSETVLLYTEAIRPSDQSGQSATQPRNTAVRLKEMLLARPMLTRVLNEHGLYQGVLRKEGLVDAIEEFREDLSFRAPGGETYTLGYRADSAETAQKVTARLADLVISEDGKARRAQARLTRDFLAGESKRTEKELKDAELELAKFMAEHPSIAMDSMLLMGGPTSGAAIRASTGGAQRAEPLAELRRAVGTWQTLGPAVRGTAPSAATGAPPVFDRAEKARAEAALAAAQADLTEKSNRFTEEHPDVRAAAAAVGRAQQRLQGMGSPAPALPAVASNSTAQPRRVFVPSRSAAPATAQEKAAGQEDLVELETQWARATRSVNETRQRHEQIEASFFKADIAASSESGGHAVQVQIIDPAYLPLKPQPPGRGLIAAIFLGLSLLLGLMVAVACAIFDDRIYDGHDADSVGPILTEVPSANNIRRAHAHA